MWPEIGHFALGLSTSNLVEIIAVGVSACGMLSALVYNVSGSNKPEVYKMQKKINGKLL